MNAAKTEKSNRKTLFEKRSFLKKLAQAKSPIPVFKEAIQSSREILNQRFKSKDKIENIITDQAWLIDQILSCAWDLYDWKDADDISLLAVGGYGRGELHPYSDIDIQILMKKDLRKKYRNNIESFLTLLWDISLEVGQSVRTVKENKSEAAKDITIATAMMESRTIVGNDALHQQMMKIVGPEKIWTSKKFFAAKREEQRQRHNRHDDIEYALEPNIKLDPGGLRDIQTIGWIAKRHYGAKNFLDLVELGFLQKNEYNDLIKGQHFLWKLRYGLHMLEGRREDRLLFGHQQSLAQLFNYKDDEKSLGTEKLMQQYYRVVLTVRYLNDVLLQLFDEDILRSKERVKIKPINKRFQIRNNYIEVAHTRVFRHYPSALIEIFVLMTQNRKIEGIRASTIRLIRNAVPLIDGKYRNDIRNTSLFMELLRSPHKLVIRLRQMKRYGVLSAYLPEFGKVVGQMQHDLFHIYTVDDHTLQVVENMRRFRHEEAKEKYPMAAEVINKLPKIELLYIAGLYHDIAKGRGGDHSVLGVKDAQNFCKRHRLGKWDTNLVAWLVRNHLVMSGTAQREDIQDPDVIHEFALKMGDQFHLDYLYALTVADINATNPNLWNTWRASLLRQLYSSTKRVLRRGLEKTVDKGDWIKETRNEALRLLAEKGFSKQQVLNIWNNPGDEYFIRENAEDIVWHTEAIAKYGKDSGPIILIKNTSNSRYEGATQIFVYTKDRRFLFADITRALDKLNLDIQDAKIFTPDGEHSMNTYIVLEEDGIPIGNKPQRLEEITQTLRHYIENPLAIRDIKAPKPSRKLRHFTRASEANINNTPGLPYSSLEVLCPDRPGLLAKIADIFVDMNITLHNAKITTLGENVEDVFFITDENNEVLKDESFIMSLEKAVREKLDAETGGN